MKPRPKLLLLSLLLACMTAPIGAQPYPPNGPHIPAINLTGGGTPPPEQPPVPGPRDVASMWNMEIAGYNDLQGRSAYQPVIIHQGSRQIAYVGHHNQEPLLNPLTGQLEKNGTSIIDVTDPANTKYLAHIPTDIKHEDGGAEMVQVCSGTVLPNGKDGEWYLLRPVANRAHEIWNVTDPQKPVHLGTVVDGLAGTHKNWWECDTGIAYLPGRRENDGWTGRNHMMIYDLSNPAEPRYIRDYGMPGQQPGATSYIGHVKGGVGLHGAISAGTEKNRIYMAHGTGSNGVLLIVDREKLLTGFNDPMKPTEAEMRAPLVGHIVMSPDQGGHTTFPIFSQPTPGFQTHPLMRNRDLLLVTSEAGRSDNCASNYPPEQLTQGRSAPQLAFIVDVTHEPTPWPLSTLRVQEGDFCKRGGRNGVHSSAESFYPPYYGKLAIIAYFNAGIRVWDIRDPFAPHEVAYFIPPPNQYTIPTCSNAETREGGEFGFESPTSTCRKVGVINNVEVDDRGLIYGTDRPGGGLHIVKLTGYARDIISDPR